MPGQLSPRERVLRAASYQEVDRVPCYFGAEDEVWPRVIRWLGVRDRVEAIRALGCDTIQVTLYRGVPDLSAVETIADLEAIPWPGPESVDIEGYVARLREARATGLAVVGGVWATLFTQARRAMGEEKYLVAMVERPELIERLVEREADSYLAINEVVFSQAAECLDICYFGTDFGAQDSLFISCEHIRRFFIPHIGRLARQAKRYGLKVMFHTCGAVADIIPDLISCGIDLLDPVQVSAKGMDPTSLARYRGQIAFHGGISTQSLLPRASPDEVRERVRWTVQTLGPTGYICGPDQWVMEDVPLENLRAMYEAAGALGRPGEAGG